VASLSFGDTKPEFRTQIQTTIEQHNVNLNHHLLGTLVKSGESCEDFSLYSDSLRKQQHPQSHPCSVCALELVVNDWLRASLNACDVVSHGIHASLGGVDLNDALKLGLAALKLALPELALGLAIFNYLIFGVLALLEHLLHVA
jgi:hypothetical protein